MSQASQADENPEYWQEYSNLQRVKHRIIREYLKGWFPKLGSWARRIVYIDTHAGRGRHGTGDLGSPLVALGTFLQHSYRDQILRKSEVRFFFLERDESNTQALQSELDAFTLPRGVSATIIRGNYEAVLSGVVTELRRAKARLAPCFVFVDPYTFRIRYSLVRDLMSFRGVELFVNIRWRELNMDMCNPGMARLLDETFDIFDWRQVMVTGDSDSRLARLLELIRGSVGVEWMTHVQMLAGNRTATHVLAHLTNHEAGRDLMKTVMWKVCPSCDGEFVARKSDDPAQGVLLALEPDLRPVVEIVRQRLSRGPLTWTALREAIRDTSWLEKHLNKVVRDLRRRGKISWVGASFSATANPLLELRIQ